MTPRQTKFVQEYLQDPNATRAAVLAGYSENSAQQQGSRLLLNAVVAEAIREAQAEAAATAKIDLAWLIREQRKVYVS